MIKIIDKAFISKLLLLSALFLIQVQAMPKVSGFASVEGNGLTTTTGGEGGQEVSVSTLSDLKKYAESSDRLIIKITKMLEGEIGDVINVKSNKSFIGVGTGTGLKKSEFHLIEVSNVIFHNLNLGGSFKGDWDGKSSPDADAIQMDGCHHIWIDHCLFTHGHDGLVDSRKNTTNVTVSWCIFRDHNKAFGIGWTTDVTATMTIHHTWFDSTSQRNPSADQLKHCHMYNNYMLDLVRDPYTYGNLARGGTNLLIENSVYHNVKHPHSYRNDGFDTKFNGALKVVNCLYDDKCTGYRDSVNGTLNFKPTDFYEYTLHPVEKVEELVRNCAGPQENFDCETSVTSISKINSRQVKSPVAVSNIGNRSILMNFPDNSAQSISIYSLNGKLQYYRNGDIGMTHTWKAPNTGMYQLRLLSRNGQTSTGTVFVIN